MVNSLQPGQDHSRPSGPESTVQFSRPHLDNVTNPSIDTQHVQPEKERWYKKKIFQMGTAVLVAIGATVGITAAMMKDGEARDPGATTTDTYTSGSQTPGPESQSQAPSTEPEADVVTGEADVPFELPKRPEELESTDIALGSERLSKEYADEFLSEKLSSDLTYNGAESSLKGIYLGGEWSFPKDPVTQDEARPTYNHKDDDGLAAHTHLAPLYDAVKECERLNNDKPCGFKVTVKREYGQGKDFPTYLKLADLTGELPDQDSVRVRQTVGGTTDNNAEITVFGFDMATLEPISSDSFHRPLADIYYVDKQGKGHTEFVSPPTDSN